MICDVVQGFRLATTSSYYKDTGLHCKLHSSCLRRIFVIICDYRYVDWTLCRFEYTLNRLRLA